MTSFVVKSFPLEEEYKKPTGITPEDIARLREWLNVQPHLPKDYITDLDLILGYQSCKRDLELAKEIIDKHFTLRTQYTALFKDRYFDHKMEMTFKRVLLTQLKGRENNEDAILYGRMLDTDVKNYVMQDSMKAVLMVLDVLQYEEGTWPGLVIIFDLTGFKLGHIFQMDVGLVKQFLHYLEQAMLVQLKAIHFLNVPSFWKYMMSIIRRFVKSDLLNMIHVHNAGSDTLAQFLPVEILPKEAGGNTKTFDECRDEMVLRMRMNSDYFVKENKKRVTESLRPQKERK